MEFETKKKLWLALSELYLDTEISEHTLNNIAKTALEEKVSYHTLYQINKEEVFPVLYKNGLSVAGVWDGFDQEWLVNTISKTMKKKSWLSKKYNQIKYYVFSSLVLTSMKQIELKLNDFKNSTP